MKQVDWLTRFLAIRGIPSVTMEFQLEALCKELSLQIPENSDRYLIFLSVSKYLKSKRNIHISDENFEKCNSVFFENCDVFNCSDKKLLYLKNNMGKLIACSLIDEINNSAQSQNTLISWLVDSAVFPNQWISAVLKSCETINLFIIN